MREYIFTPFANVETLEEKFRRSEATGQEEYQGSSDDLEFSEVGRLESSLPGWLLAIGFVALILFVTAAPNDRSSLRDSGLRIRLDIRRALHVWSEPMSIALGIVIAIIAFIAGTFFGLWIARELNREEGIDE